MSQPLSRAVCLPRLILLVLFLSSAMGELSVDISISPATTVRLGDKVRITCFLSGLRPENFVFKVRLFCPILSRDMACFQNCKPTCQAGSGCGDQQTKLMSSVRCKTFSGTNTRKFHYEFPVTSATYSGPYKCQFFARNSPTALLPAPLAALTTKAATTTKRTKPLEPTTPKKPSKQTPIVTTKKPTVPPKTTPRTPRDPCDGTDCRHVTAGDPTRERLLVLLFIFLILSAVANAIFCVRCVLINQYAKDPRRLQRISYCMSGFLCLDPEVYLRKREPSLRFQSGYSASFVASHVGDGDNGGSDSTYSMPAYAPSHPGHARSQTLPTMVAAAPSANDSHRNIVFIPMMATSLSTLRSGSQPGLNVQLSDAAQRYGVPLAPIVGAAGGFGDGSAADSGVGVSSRCLAVSPQPQPPPPPPQVPRDDGRRLSTSASRLYGNTRMTGRHLSGDSAREADEEETLIE